MKPWFFALITGKRTHTQTVTASSTWIAPPGVTFVSLSGHGQNGSNDSTVSADTTLVNVIYHASGTGVPGSSVNWNSINSTVNGVVASLNSRGSATFDRSTIDVYPDATNAVSSVSQSIPSAVHGSASLITSGGWQTSGAISSSGDAAVDYLIPVPGSAGGAATGFGQSFPGGAANASAPTTNYASVAVTPGASYALNVPAGAAITITWAT